MPDDRPSATNVKTAPQSAGRLHDSGCALQQQKRLEEALVFYEQATALDPRSHATFNNLANLLMALGRLDQAGAAYRRAIELAPQSASYYRGLTQCQRLSADDPCFVSLEALARRVETLEPAEQVDTHFALGRALADVGDHRRSFTHFMEGNRIQRGRIQYDEASTLMMLDLARRTTPVEALAKPAGGELSDRPVFVVGMPRSGSTLIEQILASHPHAFGIGECPAFTGALAKHLADRSRRGTGSGALDAEDHRQLGAAYLSSIAAVRGVGAEHRRIIDKYPFNFAALGMIRQALPNARIVHTRRSPIDTCLSCFSHLFQDAPFSYDLGELGRYYRAYDALMAHWRSALPPGVMIEVDYERLVTDFEPEARRLLAHCGLDWNEACLDFHKTDRQVFTASAAQVRRPLYKTSIARRRPDERDLRPLLDGLGADLAADLRLDHALPD